MEASLKAGLDNIISLHGRDRDVGDPQADKDARSNCLHGFRTTQLTTYCGVSPDQQDYDGDNSFTTEQGHREAQTEIICRNVFRICYETLSPYSRNLSHKLSNNLQTLIF